MIKNILLCIFTLASPLCIASTEVEVRYLGYTFNLSESPSIVAANGDVSNTMIFKFDGSGESGSVIFSNPDNDPALKELMKGEGCDYRAFIGELFDPTENPVCDQEILRQFGAFFFNNAEHGSWSSQEGIEIYYLASENRSSIMLVGAERKSVKIESGYYSLEQLKTMVLPYLQ